MKLLKLMRKILLSLLCALSLSVYSQTPIKIKNCGSVLAKERQLSLNGKINAQMMSAGFNDFFRSDKVITIPIVLHIVYRTDSENLSIDKQRIQSQIDVLNRDFRLRNTDTSYAPKEFQNLAADMKIEFYVDSIIRVRTGSTNFEPRHDLIKDKYTGGSDVVEPATHLNLYVCELEEGLLGYAHFPGDNPFTDGVVITFQAFGVDYRNPYMEWQSYNKGRVAVHEIGHWLGLYHIWGDDCPYWFNLSHPELCCCDGSDQVSDTPNQSCPSFGCPSYGFESCHYESMYMNYMDYSDNQCMSMFTKGQKERIRAAIKIYRKQLLK